jgi:hypothetical protein
MEGDKFWHLGGVTRWNSQFFIHTWTFLAIIYVASQLFLCLFWISLWLKNRCLQHPCFRNLCKIAQASKNSDSNAQHFLSDLLTHSWFHSMLFALPSYQFPYIVMNRCLYLMPSQRHHLLYLISYVFSAHFFGLSTKFGHSIPRPLDLDGHMVWRGPNFKCWEPSRFNNCLCRLTNLSCPKLVACLGLWP